MKKSEFKVSEDGTIPLITGDIKVVYSESEINTNWLLNKILGTKDKQITKISEDELARFIFILDETKIKMPDNTDSLEWLKGRIGKRYQDSTFKQGLMWEQVSQRYQYILHQIDYILTTRKVNND